MPKMPSKWPEPAQKRRRGGLVESVEGQSPSPTVFRVWVAAVLAARRSARRVSLRRVLLAARVSKDFPSGS